MEKVPSSVHQTTVIGLEGPTVDGLIVRDRANSPPSSFDLSRTIRRGMVSSHAACSESDRGSPPALVLRSNVEIRRRFFPFSQQCCVLSNIPSLSSILKRVAWFLRVGPPALLLFLFLLGPLSVARVEALHLSVHIASPWKNVERRNILRQALSACGSLLEGGHTMSYYFFMGDVNATMPIADE